LNREIKRERKSKQEQPEIIYQQKDAIRNDVEYSRVFTEDIGPIDDRFFDSPSRSPKNNQFNNSHISKANAQMMKKIG
jgi:hypothetical protein